MTTLLETGTTTGLTDGQLLDRFLDRRDDSAEAAFAALLERHGGMVRRVCREILDNSHDADDAFQAIFLILARNAGSIRHRGSAGPWLHGVALRVARCARSNAARRRRHERRRGEMVDSSGVDGTPTPLDPAVARALHEEIGRLAEKHRSPVVLCYLEGLTHEMAALQLGWPVGTVRSRLAWARDRLRGRLTRRGIAPSLFPMGLARLGEVAISSASKVPISSALTETTLRAAMRIVSTDPALAGIVSAPVAALVEEGLRAMFWTKLKLLAATTLTAGAITTGAGVAAYSYRLVDAGEQPTAATAPPAPAPKKADPGPPAAKSKEPAKKAIGRSPLEEQNSIIARYRVRELIKEYDEKFEVAANALWKAQAKLKPLQEPQGLPRKPDVAMYAGALFMEAERAPGTPAAEEALIWIARNENYGMILERSWAILARDHAATGKLDRLLDQNARRFNNSWGSPATEALLREVAAKNPHRENRGRARYYLACLLTNQAFIIQESRIMGDSLEGHWPDPLLKAGWGDDFFERVKKKNPEALTREAEELFSQVLANPDFAAIPFDDIDDQGLPDPPTTLGESAKVHLDIIRRLWIGKPAPEIAGVDLDGKPMKLSDYRGKVVAVIFCDSTKARYLIEFWKRYRNESFVVLGVPIQKRRMAPRPAEFSMSWRPKVTGFVEPTREPFLAIEKAETPVRFWWDEGKNGEIGPIRMAWHAMEMTVILIDHRGIIRSRSGSLEEAVKPLLDERKKDLGR